MEYKIIDKGSGQIENLTRQEFTERLGKKCDILTMEHEAIDTRDYIYQTDFYLYVVKK